MTKIEEAVERLGGVCELWVYLDMMPRVSALLRLLLDAYAASKGVTHYYVETCPHCGGKLEEATK